MIEAFTSYIKTITALTLFSALAELFMPEGNFRKYLEMVLGIMVLAAVVQPLFRLGESEIPIFPAEISVQSHLQKEKNYAKMQEKWVRDAYTKEMEEGILADLQNQYSTVEWVRATWEKDPKKHTYGSLQSMVIGGNKVPKEVGKYAAERYNLPFSKVRIQMDTKDGE